ncbi:MAG: hypothetical protein AAFR54_09250, partial [Planctomycetota bacterium]
MATDAVTGSPILPEIPGRVYIFEFNGTTWDLAAGLVATDIPAGLTPPPAYGFALRFANENELLVGSPGDRRWLGADPAGSYYVYQRHPTQGWRFAYKVTQPPAFEFDPRCTLGGPLRIDGDRAINVFRSLQRPVGYALELRRSTTDGRWELVDVVEFNDVRMNSRAEDYDFAGDWIFIADDNSGWGGFPGRVRVLRRTPTGWQQQADLLPPEPYVATALSGALVNERFGSGLDFDGERLVVSSIEGYLGRQGRAETFVFDGSEWVREHVVVPDDVYVNSRAFGDGVALSGDSVLAGFPSYLTEDLSAERSSV